jgi:hypothetical protein
MKNQTIQSLINLFKDAIANGRTLKQQCAIPGNKTYGAVCGDMSQIRKSLDKSNELYREAIELYEQLTKGKGRPCKTKTEDITECSLYTTAVEEVETDSRAEISYDRNSDGKIIGYNYEIYRKGKTPLVGRLSRKEMNTIHTLYSTYGDNLQQRIVNREFPELSLIDFKRILRAFNITKASAPFAPHMFEEKTEDELREIQLREKENSFLRKAEQDLIKNNEKLLKKYAQENIDLKKQIEEMSQFKVNIPDTIEPTYLEQFEPTGNDLILHLSDLHIGASVTSGTMYGENWNYGYNEAKRRLEGILAKVTELGYFDTIVINLMGDNIDCSGFTGKTARLYHVMPNNMDAREQGNNFITLMLWFVDSLIKNECCSNLKVYSVPCGNHGGNYEYMVNKALLATINVMFPNVETTLFEQFYGAYEFNERLFVLCHGKDDAYMKRGLPLNLNEDTKVKLYEWLDYEGIVGDNIHFIKGDLHSNNLNSCAKFSYRNVLSLFGASDYSNYNFSRNSYGVSYEMFINGNLVRGTFENV